MSPEVRAEVEAWFRRRGLPHFIDSYSARHDVLTRALPILTLAFLVEVVNAPKASFPWWLDVIAVVGGFAILLGAWAAVNRTRGRAALALPTDVGPTEVGVFVFVPAILPLVFGQQYVSAAVTLVGNACFLGVVYLVLSYGVVPTVSWAASRLGVQLSAMTALLIRALPLMLLVVTFFFLTAEVWQSVGSLAGISYPVVLLLFVAVGTAFIVARLPRDLANLGHFETDIDLATLVEGTPASALPICAPHEPPLSRREWGNVGLVALISQGIQIVLVSALIGAFFVLLGAFAVTEATTQAWVVTDAPRVLARLSFGGSDLVITEPLLRVSGFIAAFAGLQFTMNLLTDATYREEFREEVVAEIRQAFAVREIYRNALTTD